MAKKIYTDEEIKKHIDALPEDVRKLVYSAEMDEIIQRVGLKNQLHVDQLALLEAETGEVMMGFIESKDFVADIAKTLEVDTPKAEAIARDINELLFLKIRESMKKGPSVATPIPAKVVPPVVPPPSFAPKPAIAPHPADLMLTQKTVSTAPVVPKPVVPPGAAPQPYKADPYREPPQ